MRDIRAWPPSTLAGAISAAAIAFSLLISAPANARDDSPSILGVWRMVSLEVASPSGQLRQTPYTGEIIFTGRGTMSIQAMDPDPNAPPTPFSKAGYEAFYGPVVIDQANKTYTVTVQSSVARTLLGQKLTRRFEVSANRLIITSPNPQERFRATYERH
jgi:hypothetical protein